MKSPFRKSLVDDLRSAVVAAEADEIAARREAEAAATAREAALLDPDEEIALKADEDARRAVLRLDRAEARLAAARAALAEAEEADRRARTEAEHRRLIAANAALADRLTTFLATSTDAARTLIADLHRQRDAVTAFNAAAPAALRVDDPEAFRSTPSIPEEVVSETVGYLWVKHGTTTPVASQSNVRVGEDGRSGFVNMPGGASLSVQKRKVRRMLVIPGRPGNAFHPLAEQLALPSLRPSYRPGWAPTPGHEVGAALAALAVPPGEPAKADPVEKIVFID